LKHNKYLIILFVFILIGNLSSQNSISLQETLNSNSITDSVKGRIILNLGWEKRINNPDTSIKLAFLSEKYIHSSDALLNKKNSLLIRSYNNLGLRFASQGKDSLAMLCYQKGLDLSKVSIDEAGVKILSNNANRLKYNLGIKYYNTGNDSLAMLYYQKGLALSERTKDEDGIRIYNLNISKLYIRQFKFNEAISVYKKILTLTSVKVDTGALADTYLNIGISYLKIEDPENSLLYLKNCLKLAEGIKDKMTLSYLFLNLGDAYIKSGDLSEAEININKGLALNIALNNSHGVIGCYYTLSKIYNFKNNYPLSLELINKGIAVSIKSKDKEHEAEGYGRLGSLYEDLGNLNFALENELKALEINKELGNKYALSKNYGVLGNLYAGKLEYKEAMNYYKKCLLIEVELENTNSISLTLMNMGTLAESAELGDSVTYTAFNNALLGFEEVGNNNEIARVYKNLGHFEFKRNRFESAEMYYNKCYSIWLKTKNKDIRAVELDLAKTFYCRKKYFEAINLIENVLSNNKKQIIDNYSILSEEQLGYFISGFRESEWLLSNIIFNGDKRYSNKAIGLLMESRLFYKNLEINHSMAYKVALEFKSEKNIIEQYYLWQKKKKKVAQFMEIPEAHSQSEINAQIRQADSIEVELNKSTSNFTKKALLNETKVNDIKRKLKEGEAALEIIRYSRYTYVPWDYDSTKVMPGYSDSVMYLGLVITSTNEEIFAINLKNGNFLENEALSKYNYYTNNPTSKYDIESFNNYWKPFDSILTSFKKIYISPDGVYNKLNLGALFNTKNKKYLVEEKESTMVSSLAELISEEKPILNKGLNAVLIGDPKFLLENDRIDQLAVLDSTRNRMILSPLPGTKKEVVEIGSLLSKSKVKTSIFLNENAKEDSVKKIKSPTILHFATHGFFKQDERKTRNPNFNLESMLKSGLVLSGAQNSENGDKLKGKENGLLYALEISEMDLRKTKLVVLSACETAKGVVQNGVGVYGLQRAFKKAGAQQIVMSMWSVPDEETVELMTEFYKYYLLNFDASKSLRLAQLNMIKKHPKDPFYWGAFVVMGK
jgi:CHAT domain-containing protein